MTRFARAKGSKASNQRIPEEATPWSELKQKVKKESNNSNEWSTPQGEVNWKEVINNDNKIENNINSVWCDFSDDDTNFKDQQFSKNKKNKCDFPEDDTNFKDQQVQNNKKKKCDFPEDDTNINDQRVKKNKKKNCDLEESTVEMKGKRLSKKKRNIDRTIDSPETSKNRTSSEAEETKEDGHANNLTPTLGPSEDNSKSQLRGKFKGSSNWSITGKEHKLASFQSLPHKRRKVDHGDHRIEINGQDIAVTRLDGFFIRKEDAERIRNLEKSLIKKGVSKEEVKAVVKKERRNAEKSLARQKKKVCFHCRVGGHNLSSCPKLSETMGSGICYKCGSTEHSHLECKVSTGYKFAVCFICKEEGHIARECPDNPRGLYPQGGACKVCGDVTHLRRDCPEATKEKVTLDLIEDDLEELSSTNPVNAKPNQKRKNKIIKFK